MDEAFVPLHRIIQGMAPAVGDLCDDDVGVHMYIDRFEIESPLELDVVRDPDRGLEIGSTPPIYYVDTAQRPSYHRIRYTAELSGEPDGG
jgi:hypothetical protein